MRVYLVLIESIKKELLEQPIEWRENHYSIEMHQASHKKIGKMEHKQMGTSKMQTPQKVNPCFYTK